MNTIQQCVNCGLRVKLILHNFPNVMLNGTFENINYVFKKFQFLNLSQ